jgi:hypothetical protein
LTAGKMNFVQISPLVKLRLSVDAVVTLTAGEIRNPCLGLGGDPRLPAARGRSSSAVSGPQIDARSTQR